MGHDYISRKQSLITEVQETLENLKDLRKHGGLFGISKYI